MTQQEIENAGNRLYSLALSSADGLEYLARTLDAQGAFDGKTVGVVMQDSPGDPDIVQDGLLDTLKDLGVDVKLVDTLGCGGGNSCRTGVIESVQEMIADGVDVLFPLLNVINLPGYLQEMVTQGVKPGQVQFYQSGYNAQNGDLVSSKVVTFAGDEAGKLYNGTKIVAAGPTGAFRVPDFQPNEFGEMCNREYQAAGGAKYTRDRPEDELAVRRDGREVHLRPHDRARDRRGRTEPHAQVPGGRERGSVAIDTGGEYPGSFARASTRHRTR